MKTDTELEHLSTILREAGSAHHKAFIETNGADPDRPLWYAEFLFGELQQDAFTKSELVCLLLKAERVHKDAPGTDWASYYARFLKERYG